MFRIALGGYYKNPQKTWSGIMDQNEIPRNITQEIFDALNGDISQMLPYFYEVPILYSDASEDMVKTAVSSGMVETTTFDEAFLKIAQEFAESSVPMVDCDGNLLGKCPYEQNRIVTVALLKENEENDIKVLKVVDVSDQHNKTLGSVLLEEVLKLILDDTSPTPNWVVDFIKEHTRLKEAYLNREFEGQALKRD